MADNPRITPEAQKLAEEQYRLTAKAYEEVGRGISTWAGVEDRLVQIVSILLEVTAHKAGLILYSINNFYTWVSIIDGLFADATKYEKAHKQWSKIVSQLKAQNDTRVRLAHQSLFLDIFESDDGSIKTQVAGLRASPFDTRAKSRTLKSLTIEEIVEFRDKAYDLHEKLGVVYRSILPASPTDKPFDEKC